MTYSWGEWINNTITAGEALQAGATAVIGTLAAFVIARYAANRGATAAIKASQESQMRTAIAALALELREIERLVTARTFHLTAEQKQALEEDRAEASRLLPIGGYLPLPEQQLDATWFYVSALPKEAIRATARARRTVTEYNRLASRHNEVRASHQQISASYGGVVPLSVKSPTTSTEDRSLLRLLLSAGVNCASASTYLDQYLGTDSRELND